MALPIPIARAAPRLPKARLPKTSPRGQSGFLRLLTRIDLAAPLGLQFVGQVLTPGAAFDPAALPRPAVILEYAGRERIAPYRSRYAFDDLWLIWRYDFECAEWIELVRTHAFGDASWTHDLAFMAHKRLFPLGETPAEERARPVARELEAAIASALESVNAEVRAHVVRALDQYLGREIVRVSDELSVKKTRSGRNGKYPRIGGSAGAKN